MLVLRHVGLRPLILLLAALTCVAATPPGGSAAGPRAASAADDAVLLVDVSGLASERVDALLDLPAASTRIEFGDVAVLRGGADLRAELSRAFPGLAVRPVAAAGRPLWHVVLDGPCLPGALPEHACGRVGAWPEGLELLAGRGRQALALAPTSLVEAGPFDGLVLRPAPARTALVQRLDRWRPAVDDAPASYAVTVPILESAVDAVDLDHYATTLGGLLQFPTRYTHADAFPDVTSWYADALSDLGYAVSLDPFTIGGKTRHNVIAELPGDVTPEQVVIVCAHYDSTSPNPQVSAPGADDNASGAAAVIELARVLRSYRFASTVRFIGFAGEEQGLVGSARYVDDLIASGELDDVLGVINLDMIGYLNTGDWDVLLEGKAGVSAPLLNALPRLVSEYTQLEGYVSTNPYGSDHIPFINAGVNAVLLIEYEDWFNPYYHSTGDQLSTLTLPFALQIVKLAAAAAADLAGIHGGYLLDHGVGLAGSGGFVPDVSGAGSANLGEAFGIALEGALGGASGFLLLGSEPAALPKYGGQILVGPLGSLAIVPLTLPGPATPGAGALTLESSVPADPGLTGLSLHLQYVFADPGASFGRSLSDALELVVGV